MSKKIGRPKKPILRFGLRTRLKFLIFGTAASLTTKRKYQRRAKTTYTNCKPTIIP